MTAKEKKVELSYDAAVWMRYALSTIQLTIPLAQAREEAAKIGGYMDELNDAIIDATPGEEKVKLEAVES